MYDNYISGTIVSRSCLCKRILEQHCFSSHRENTLFDYE